MAIKPTYEELEQKVKKLENESTERKQAEALSDNDEKYRIFIDTLPDMIYRLRVFHDDVNPEQKEQILSLIDEIRQTNKDELDEVIARNIDQMVPFVDGTLIESNEIASKILGYSLEMLGSINMADILAPEYLEEALKNTFRIFALKNQRGLL